jgi:hypothetical protein
MARAALEWAAARVLSLTAFLCRILDHLLWPAIERVTIVCAQASSCCRNEYGHKICCDLGLVAVAIRNTLDESDAIVVVVGKRR